MSIVDNKVLDPKLVANVDADPANKETYHGKCILCSQFHGRMCIYRNIFHGCSPDWNIDCNAGNYCNVYRMHCYCSSTCNCR